MINIVDGNIRIRPFLKDDFSLMYKWLTNDKVLEFYGGRDKNYTYDSIVEHYSKTFDYPFERVIIEYNDIPIGYGQLYELTDELYSEYNYTNTGKCVYAMDQFIGEVDYWNKGIGSKYISIMCNYLKGIGVNSILLDPHIDNIRAIKSYQKCGFKIINELVGHEHFEGKDVDCYLMENNFEKFNSNHFKYLIENNIKINISSIEYLGNGDDSVAYLINDCYVFKIKYNLLKNKSYEKEKKIYDFLNSNLKCDIKIPNVEYFYSGDECEIIGYKKIDGIVLSPKIYNSMFTEEQELLKNDIVLFLKELHSLDYSELNNCFIDNKKRILEMCTYLEKNTKLSIELEKYINDLRFKVDNCCLFNKRVCLCHNDLSCKHMLIDSNNRLCGIIDFGDSGVTDIYSDFMYLLEDSEEEISPEFGKDIIKKYSDIDLDDACLYQELMELVYPIELIYYGINNKIDDSILLGNKIINDFY